MASPAPTTDSARLLDRLLENQFDDAVLTRLVAHELPARKAHLCWHKHGTFLDHLVGVARMVVLWGGPTDLARVALVHSAYGNSYVNLALFSGVEERPHVQTLVGARAEELTHTFCTINRQKVILETLGRMSEIPHDGLEGISREEAALFVKLTIADLCDQQFDWQHQMGMDQSISIPDGVGVPGVLWPGSGKPGLHLSFCSRLAALLPACADVVLAPPIFDGGTRVLDAQAEREARDLYWDAVVVRELQGAEAAAAMARVSELNPFVAEPHVVRAHALCSAGDFDAAAQDVAAAQRLWEAWGTCWDKRMSFGAWWAWTKVLARVCQERAYPRTAWGVINLGRTW